MQNRSYFRLISLGLGFAFLYLPILMLIIYSFNESRFVNVWGGFSTKWYQTLFENDEILDAAFLSIKIAAVTATISVFIGTLAALALVRFGNFKGRFLFSGLVTAPLVMPEVIIGLSFLLLFIALESLTGWPSNLGFSTITIAHVTLSLAYVVIIIRARLQSFDYSLEEAALDLGAKPYKVFFKITLPIIMPALCAAWLLAFTLSLDDLVVASFVTGPGATTLPMAIYASIRTGVSPEINALATLIVLFISLGIAMAAIIMNRKRNDRASY
jgi:putrescine transport system permease protein